MPQNEYMERWRKLHGRRLDHEERVRKRTAREGHKASQDAQNLRGLRAKLYQKKRHNEKIQMKKAIKAHEERNVKTADEKEPSTPMPSYLLDRTNPTTAKALSSAIKNKRAEKAARVQRAAAQGARHQRGGDVQGGQDGQEGAEEGVEAHGDEADVRGAGLHAPQPQANVTHPELGVTVQLPIISVKKNPQNPLYTQLGVLTKGTVIEVNVSELGLVTAGGKVVWGRYAQVTNNPENEGCINSVLLV
ncbi:hypothetical protein ACCO45_003464 [Purpureocillium lilacinum]|uniref:Uncharacterized protein n=1 Tax=Purpureocillium lilacinum TaxID=33203 RepID=A0ACC4E0B8_PURLI